MFKIGQKIIYPTHGLSVIKSISNKIIGRQSKQFYVIQVLSSELIIILPIENTVLRPVFSQNEAKELLKYIENYKPIVSTETWNRQYRNFLEKLRTNIPKELAEVYKSLIVLKNIKELSFGERNMLENVKRQLNNEFLEVLGKEVL